MSRASNKAAPVANVGIARRGHSKPLTLIEQEAEKARRSLRQFEHARALARQLADQGNSTASREAAELAWSIVRDADPVRLSFAAEILDLSVPTTNAWMEAGLLEDFGGTPRRVGLESVAQVQELVRDFRKSGRQRDLMTAVLRRLEREELERDTRFIESVEQMRRGEWAK